MEEPEEKTWEHFRRGNDKIQVNHGQTQTITDANTDGYGQSGQGGRNGRTPLNRPFGVAGDKV